MSSIQPKQDNNQNTSLFGISGSLGATYGTAETRPLTLDDNGYLNVNASVSTGNTPGGTLNRIGSIDVIGTMPAISLALNTGTITTVAAGTLNTLGTVGTIPGVGTITNIGSISNIGTMPAISIGESTGGTLDIITRVGNIGTIESGTVTTTLALNTGTITTIAAGTQNTLGTVGTVIGIGTLTGVGALPAHAITLGTVLGPNAAAGTSTTAPVQIGGTTATGTVYGILTDTAGHLHIDIETGTLQSAGTTTGVGVVSSVTNLVAGTILSSGTTTGVGVVTNLTSGSVRMTVGTLTTGSLTNVANLLTQTAGTLNTLGTVGNLNYGTVAIDFKPAGSQVLTTHTLGTGGGTFFGTMLSPVGAGTYIYLTAVSIVGRSGGSIDVGVATNVAGTTGAGVIARGFFPTAGGGIRQEFNPVMRIGTNGTLAYFLVTAGTADFVASYWVGP